MNEKLSPWTPEPGTPRALEEFKKETLYEIRNQIRSLSKKFDIIYSIEEVEEGLHYQVEPGDEEKFKEVMGEILDQVNDLMRTQDKPFHFELEDRGSLIILREDSEKQ